MKRLRKVHNVQVKLWAHWIEYGKLQRSVYWLHCKTYFQYSRDLWLTNWRRHLSSMVVYIKNHFSLLTTGECFIVQLSIPFNKTARSPRVVIALTGFCYYSITFQSALVIDTWNCDVAVFFYKPRKNRFGVHQTILTGIEQNWMILGCHKKLTKTVINEIENGIILVYRNIPGSI